VLAAQPLPPACNQTKHHYPVVALMGPINSVTPPPTPEVLAQLPAEALEVLNAAGGGIKLHDNPKIRGRQQREQFIPESFRLADTTGEILANANRWFLVDGQSQGNMGGGSEHYVSESIFGLIFQGGGAAPFFHTTYYVVVWSTGGNGFDYTMAIGLGEEMTDVYRNLDIVRLTQDNNHLHTPCTTPYPNDPAPDNTGVEDVHILPYLVTFPDDFLGGP
jgi:hypothetical protein